VEEALETASNWEFDAFHLADVTQGNSLSVLGFYLFHKSSFIANCKLDAAALARWDSCCQWDHEQCRMLMLMLSMSM
jgi:hypothetical protein